jgi:cell wall assembly regulator SMI1
VSGLWRHRPVRLALVAALVLVGASAAAPVFAPGQLIDELVTCTGSATASEIFMDCGDPEFEAYLTAKALTPEEARSIGCPPFRPADDRAAPPEPYVEPTPAPARTPDPAIAARVDRAWDRIERWLAAHASATLRALRPGVDAAELTRWEQTSGRRLPDDLFASYLRHDGAGDDSGAGFVLPGGYRLDPHHKIASSAADHCHDLVLDGDIDAAHPEHGRWHGSLIAIGSDDAGGDLFVEPRTGRVGEAPHGENVRYAGPMGWPSYVTMLEAVAGVLGTEASLRAWYPVVTGCELRWARRPAPLPSGCSGTPAPSPTPTPSRTGLTAAEIRASGCRPARRTPAVRPPGPHTAAKVNAVWRRIERWLAREAPVTHRRLRPPAHPAAIAAAEAAMGVRFPDDLRASLLRHDGSESFGFGPPPFYDLLPAKYIRSEWKVMCEVLLDGPPENIGAWWSGHLIPYARAADGGLLVIDSRTGRTGEQFSETGLTADGDIARPSYLAVLRATARSLETGDPMMGWRPTVKNGELDWKQA